MGAVIVSFACLMLGVFLLALVGDPHWDQLDRDS